MTVPAPPGATHHIRRLALDARTSSLEDAFALRGRLEVLANQTLPGIAARVADALVPPDVHLRLERLELDLGRLPGAALEADAAAAFEAAFAEALQSALHDVHNVPGAQRLSAEAASLADFEAYLLTGQLPYRQAGQNFAPMAWFAALAAGQPAALVAMLRRLGANHHALTRLLLQTGLPGLTQMLELIAPADAAAILLLLADIMLVHDSAPLLALGPPALRLTLWRLTLVFLLRDAGSQFNRRSHLQFLLTGTAEQEGIAYLTLLGLLRAGLAQLRRQAGLSGTLPAVLAELLAATQAAAEAEAAQPEAALPDQISFVRRHAANRAALAAFLAGLSAAAFTRLVTALEPAHGAVILAYLADLAALHREEALVALGQAAFEQLTWLITLLHLLRDPGSQFNRLSWLRAVLAGIAAEAGLDYSGLLAILARAAVRLQRHLPPGAALPGLLATLAAELPPLAAAGPPAPALASWLAEDTGEANLAVRLQAIPLAALTQALATLPEARGAKLLARLAPAFASDAQALLADIWQRAAAGPASPIGLAGLRALSLALALKPLAAPRHAPITPDAFAAALAAGLAAHGAAPPPAKAAPSDALAVAAAFLRTGTPPHTGHSLTIAARDNPSGLAALARRLAAEYPGNLPGMLARLRAWLLPEEIFAFLHPQDATRMAQWAASLAEPDAAWEAVLIAALRGEAPPPHAASPGARLDEAAWLAHWLDHEALPWWAPAHTAPAAALAAARLATLQALFRPAEDALIMPRLARAAAALGPAAARALLHRLAPWTAAEAGPLAPALAGLTPPEALDILLRATAASLTGTQTTAPPASSPLPPPRDISPPPLPAILAWLDRGSPAMPDAARLIRAMAALADAQNPALLTELRARLTQPTLLANWVTLLPAELLGRLAHLLNPLQGRVALELMSLLALARRQTAPPPWGALLTTLAAKPPVSAAGIATALTIAFAGAEPQAAARLRTAALPLARAGGYHAAAAALTITASPPAVSPPAKPARAAPPEPPAPRPGDITYIANAGLVLLNPFLPMLFARLNLLTTPESGPPAILGDAASRAVHLLQYIADGRLDAPEPGLVLNKLLCGLAPATPVAPAITATPEDLAICDELLRAVIANWPIIANTSPDGLQETFLQREGRLQRGEDRWDLTIQRKTLDVLVDQIPWSFLITYHRWMSGPIHVGW